MWTLMLADGQDEQAKNFLQTAIPPREIPIIPASASALSEPPYQPDLRGTFVNEWGANQDMFTAAHDDYWKPGRYAHEAALYNQQHNGFLNKNLTSGI